MVAEHVHLAKPAKAEAGNVRLLRSARGVSGRTPVVEPADAPGEGRADELAAAVRAPASPPSGRSHVDGLPAPASVVETVARPGRPLDADTRQYFEPRFGHDFSHVRVHTDHGADVSARSVSAAAYTVGSDIVFGAGRYAPGTSTFTRLMAHELAHVVQDGARDVPVVHRWSVIDEFLGLFAGENFPDETLLEYLGTIDRTNAPEDHTDSDNKARAVVRKWKAGDRRFVVTARRAVTLIREMQSGWVSDVDQQGILDILERAGDADLVHIFGGVSARRLVSDFGDYRGRLVAFFARRFQGGHEAVQAGRVVPQGAPVPVAATVPPIPAEEQPRAPGCTLLDPGACHSYEAWLETFGAEITPRTQFLGDTTRTRVTDPNAPRSRRRSPQVVGPPYLPTDRFIDGPTQEWVETHLPPHLAETAYQLPTDCADIAVVLRHVWLVAHRRSETYTATNGRRWHIGSNLQDPRSADLNRMLTMEVWSATVQSVTRPYTDAHGRPLRNFPALEPMLRPGDVLVWDHLRGSGHTHTIQRIDRDQQGRITTIVGLQGNQPIGPGEAQAIRRANPGAPSERDLRNAPARRIEVSQVPLDRTGPVWSWGDRDTYLVAAGPPGLTTLGTGPAAAQRGPAAGAANVRAAADVDAVLSSVEAVLNDMRSDLDGGRPVASADATQFATAAGSRLWQVAKTAARTRSAEATTQATANRPTPLRADDLGEESHFRPLRHVLGMMAAYAQRARTPAGRTLFSDMARAFEPAARGMADANFAAGSQDVRVLVTSFDPFERSGDPVEPARGRWNPSGAAVLALDGETVGWARVEGAILPVSYGAFRAGVVEQFLAGRQPPPEAVLTISEASGPTAQIERFAVGVHQLKPSGRMERVPAPPGTSDIGAPVQEARGVEGHAGGQDVIAAAGLGKQAVYGTNLTIRLQTTADAQRVATAFGGTAAGLEVMISGQNQATRFAQSISQGLQGAGLLVALPGGNRLPFELMEGPGGNFLSNEVSYRTLRWIGAGGASRAGMTSFHVHTLGAPDIPQPAATPSQQATRRTALGSARDVLSRTLATLRALIRAVADRIWSRRRP